jgi:putative transposase
MVKGVEPFPSHGVQALPHSITLTAADRAALLDYLRRSSDPALRARAHIILLLADGYAWSLITAVLFCSSRTVARWQQRFQRGGVPALLGRPRGAPVRLGVRWCDLVVEWVTRHRPRAFGFFRSRWCCSLLALVLQRDYALDIGRETIRRWLQREDLVWRRPRPVLQRTDPRKEEILQELRVLLRDLPEDETVVFQDEVDVNLNPDIGCMWMYRGQQAQLVTPGDNAKCYLAGSLHWRTGVLFTTEGPRRDATLLVRHLHELRRRLRRYRKIHVICDNAKFHYDCWTVWEFVHQYGDRVVLHFLPKYAPECNPIERIWWQLREAITRNHTCQNLPELIELVLGWLTERKSFPVEDAVYRLPKAG